MSEAIIGILRKTMSAIQRSDEFRQDAPEVIALRRDLTRVIAELELMQSMRSARIAEIEAREYESSS